MTPGGWRIAELSTLAYGDAVRSDGYNNNLGDPNLLADILGEIAGGSTLVLQAEAKGIPYKLLNRWIADDVERAKRYALALEIREQHAKDLIVAELVAYLKADVTEAFEGPNLKDLADMPPNLRRMVAGIKFNEVFTTIGSGKEKTRVHTGNIIEVKFIDKTKTIELFMRNLAMLVDRKEITGTLSLADLIAAVDGDKPNIAKPATDDAPTTRH